MHESFIRIVVELVFAGISVVALYYFIRAFLKQERKIHIVWKALVVIGIFIVRFFSNYFFYDSVWVISGVSVVGAILVGAVCFRVKWLWIILSVAFFWLASACAELVSVFIITAFQPVPVNEFMLHSTHRLQGQTISYLLMLMLITLMSHFKLRKMHFINFKIALAFCALPLVSMFIAYQFVMYAVRHIYTPAISDILILFSLIFVNTLIFLLIESLVREESKSRMLLLLKIQNEAQQSHIVQLMESQAQIQKISHDFKQNVESLLALCVDNNYEQLSSNLYKLSNSHPTYLLVNTENIMLDALLSSKMEKAEKNNIKFDLKLKILPKLEGITMDICTLLGNALDNAIEACVRSKENDQFIKLELEISTLQFVCRIKNTLGTAPKLDGKYYRTLKPDYKFHGIGLRSMGQTCDTLGGSLDFWHDDKYFECQIYLPM